MMDEAKRQETLRAAGIYLIVILALLRFFVYPLSNALEKEKRIHSAQQESYRLKVRLVDRQQQNRILDSISVKRIELTPYLYERPQSLLQIQLQIVEKMNKLANEKGAELIRFEILEALQGKILGEATVTLWFNGSPQALMNVLRAVETERKILSIKNMEISKGRKDYVLSLTVTAYRLET